MSSTASLLGPYIPAGTVIQVGRYATKIVRYLSEGGFSHVYIAKLDTPFKGKDVAVLKRIVAPDKQHLAAIRTEVDTMKRLKGHKHIVTYIDSHASSMKQGGFEVYVLMEFCPGGGLIDFMNTRLQTRLAEWEVLKIFSDTVEAVACMHYLRPAPLLHRDLKIENVLIAAPDCYKLCDFGSCCEPKPPAETSAQRRMLEDDIQANTTIQYRSPEMIDLKRRLPIDEKSDVWALGVMLYKLCYFTTPFEAQGPIAILNAAYTFPPYPPYTDRTKRLIAVMLQEDPRARPNIYQLLGEVCAMRNVPIPIPDIYSKPKDVPRARSEERKGLSDHSRPQDISNRLSAPSAGHATPRRDGDSSHVKALPVPPTSANITSEDDIERLRTTPSSRSLPNEALRRQKSTSSIPGPARVDPMAGLGSEIAAKPSDQSFEAKFPSLEELGFDLAAQTEDMSGQRMRKSPLVPDGTPRDAKPSISHHDRPQALTAAQHTDTISVRPSAVKQSGWLQKAQLPDDSQEQVRAAPDLISLDSPSSDRMTSLRDMQTENMPGAVLRPKPKLAAKPAVQTQSPVAPEKPQNLVKYAPATQAARAAELPAPSGVSQPVRPRSNNGNRPQSMFVGDQGSTDVESLQQSIALAKARFEGTDRVLQESRRNPPSNTADLKRSASVSVSSRPVHGRKPSLTKLPSFSNTKHLVGGRFGDALRKFDPSAHRSQPRRAELPNPSAPLEVTSDPVSQDLEEQLRASAARRSLSFDRNNRPPPTARAQLNPAIRQPEPVHPTQSRASDEAVETGSYSMQEAIQRLKSKASAGYSGPKTATGYGKYTDQPERAKTVTPLVTNPSMSTSNAIRHGSPALRLPAHHVGRTAGALDRASTASTTSDDTDSFARRFPSLQDVDFAV